MPERILKTYSPFSPRWQHESLVVAVNHGHDSDGPGRQTPRVLMGEFFPAFAALKYDLEHLGEVLTQMMRGGACDGRYRDSLQIRTASSI